MEAGNQPTAAHEMQRCSAFGAMPMKCKSVPTLVCWQVWHKREYYSLSSTKF